MTQRNRDVATVRYVLGQHLVSMSRLMTQAKDGWLDLGRELAFFVQVGYWKFLQPNKDFRERWEHYWSNDWVKGLDENDVFQDRKYRIEVEILGYACYLYTEAGLLHPTSTPWDLPTEPPGEQAGVAWDVAAPDAEAPA